MKKSLAFLLAFSCLIASAQQKYQSLLWKISGNNLAKESYLYGTMHVSSKVAFRLDDVFYEALTKSDVVALESDPTTWMSNSYENMTAGNRYNNSYNSYGNFYENLFKLASPRDRAIRSFIRFDNSIINGYLYRKSNGADNFEEETYLDMFIYQAGKKQEKDIVGLEDFKESRYLTTKASYNPVKKKIDVWLRKKYKEENGGYMLTEDAYRNRNLDLLDSIGEASNTQHFRKYMLYERNANMVEVLDSVMQEKSVFSGVGAAHLPGEQGMIEMLRRKGYTVTPLKSNQSSYGKKAKIKIEDTFIKPSLKKYFTEDKFLAIKSFEELRELNFFGQKYYVATDMTNGGYLAITRINSFDYLSKKPKNHMNRIDDLLFEDIPGEIISKERIEAPYEGIKIINKTKKDDYQRYLIYKTPLEIIIIKLGGKKDYVLKYGDEIFDSVEFKEFPKKLENMTPAYGKYSIEMPKGYIAENMTVAGKRIIQGYDTTSFYFLQESPLHDTRYIEEDTFEAKYIHKVFVKNLKLKNKLIGSYKDASYASYQSKVLIDSSKAKHLVLRSIVKDEAYYLLGYVGNDTIRANNYFDSFKFKDILYQDEFKKEIDTSLHFSVYTNVKKPMASRYYGRKKEKSYQQKIKRTTYSSKTNEQIQVVRTKYHDLRMFANIDTLWSNIHKKHSKNFTITDEEKSIENDVFIYELTLSDSLSDKRILVKNILKKGTLFELKTLEDKRFKRSKFVKEFYETFSPLDTMLGETPFKDKAPIFLEALQKNDSIIYQSFYGIHFKDKDADAIIEILQKHKFTKGQRFIKSNLIKKLIKLKSARIKPFLKHLYSKSYNEPENQISIIKGLMHKNDKESYDYILELLAIDFPISTYSLNSMFELSKDKDSMALNKKLFPELLKYSSIQEYKKPIYTLLSQLKQKGELKTKVYKKYKEQLLYDAKIELKRSLTKNRTGYTANRKANRLILEEYTYLLFPFRKEKGMMQFFNKLVDAEDINALATYVYLLKKNKEAVSKKLYDKVYHGSKSIHVLAKKLSDDELLPKELNDSMFRKKYAESKLFENVYYSQDKDSISFHKMKTLNLDETKVSVYFFKLKKKSQYSTSNTLYYIALEHKNGSLVLKPYYGSGNRGIFIDETKTDEELVTEALEKVQYKNRNRIVPKRYDNLLN